MSTFDDNDIARLDWAMLDPEAGLVDAEMVFGGAYAPLTQSAQPDDNREPPTPVPGGADVDLEEMSRIAHTDLGNARRFDRRFGSDVLWYSSRGGWLLWTGAIWSWSEHRVEHQMAIETVDRLHDEVRLCEQVLKNLPPPDDEDKEAAAVRKRAESRLTAIRKHAVRSQASGRIAAILNEFRGLRDRAVAAADLDGNKDLLVAQNVTIDLATMTARSHHRDDHCTKMVRCEYDPEARSPTWEMFLEQVLPSYEIRAFLQRWFGYCLTTSVAEQKWLVLTGAGSNGKNTMLEAMRHMLGPYAAMMPPRFLELRPQEQHPTELMVLHGARMAIGTEPRKDAKWDAERVKQLTGDATITARYMHRDSIEIPITSKLVVLCNDIPSSDDTGHSFYRRLIIVPFDIVVTKVNKDLPEMLRAEESGILNWMLKGLREYRRRGLDVPGECLQATKDYRLKQEPVLWFTDTECTVDKDNKALVTPMSDLYQAFRDWYDRRGIRERLPSMIAFGKTLSRMGFEAGLATGTRTTIRRGIVLKADSQARLDASRRTQDTTMRHPYAPDDDT